MSFVFPSVLVVLEALDDIQIMSLIVKKTRLGVDIPDATIYSLNTRRHGVRHHHDQS